VAVCDGRGRLSRHNGPSLNLIERRELGHCRHRRDGVDEVDIGHLFQLLRSRLEMRASLVSLCLELERYLRKVCQKLFMGAPKNIRRFLRQLDPEWPLHRLFSPEVTTAGCRRNDPA